jgi:hypothetical protein
MLAEIKKTIIDQEIPGLNMQELTSEKGALKLMFMTFGLDELIKQGCIKKMQNGNDNKIKYVIVKIPKTGWAEALGVLSKNKATLYDKSKGNLAKWEAVRASLDKGAQARNFILKIFKLTNSQVKQNTNWWEKMWHWDGKGRKEVNMEYLGNVTLNPSDLEKHVSSDRGYNDMMEKTSKRVEGTSIYEPQKEEVLKLSNSYLEMSLLATFMNASPKNLENITNRLLSEFNIAGKVKLQKPLERKENRLENVKKIYEAIALKNLDPSNVTEAHIRMIQLGYVAQRQMETALEQENVLSGNLSSNPLYKEIQLQAFKDGCPIYKLKEIEQKIHLGIFGLSQGIPGTPTFNVRGLGAAASIDLGEWGGQKWHFSAGAAGVDGRFMPFAEVGAAIKLGKKVTLKWSLGTTVGFSGASTAVEFPITSEWDMYVGAGVGADWKEGRFGAGAGVGAKWNQMRTEKIKKDAELTERGVENIDAMIKNNNISKASEAILANPTFGEYVKAIKDKFKLPDTVIVDIYKNARTEWLNEAKRGIKIPAITGFGAGVFAGVSKTLLENGVSVGAYITFKIPGTTVNYVVRQEHPQYSEYAQSKVAEEDLRKKLKEAGNGSNNIISAFTLSAKSGIVYFDSRLGRGHVTKPNGTTEAKQTMAIKENEREAEVSAGGTFESIKKTFADLDMHVEMIKDPKNPKNTILAVTPLQTEGSNVEMLMDPELKSKGIIFDNQNNRILLAASEASKLNITRTRYRYPFNRRGAMNLDVIAFKDNPDRSNMEIKEDSPLYMYKYKGEKYAMVRGEARTGLKYEEGNTMTLDQYKERKATYETFNNRQLEYSLKEGKNLTTGMSEAIGYKEKETVRFNQLKLEQFTDSFLKRNLESFDRGLGAANTPESENIFKTNVFNQLKKAFQQHAGNVLGDKKLSLNEQELNLIYTYMLNTSFVKLKDKNEAVITSRLERRNGLFKNYMKKYVNEFMNRYPDKWAEIKVIDPSANPETIANYLMLTMPQNARQFKEFEKREQLPISEGLKFASYANKYGNEALATSYGMEMPEKFNDILKMVGPTKLNINSSIPQERATAKLILQVMSPLDTRNPETAKGKKNFLQSELSLLLITMYDEATGVSPMIEVLGKKNYEGMLAIYNEIKVGKSGNLEGVLKTNEQAFNKFKELVTGVRNAQLSGEKTFMFNKKYEFHLEKTEIYSGAYLKCGNGTIAARQQIGISISREGVGGWAGAKTGVNIAGIPDERLGFKEFSVGWLHTFKSKPNEGGKKNPPSDDEPGKGPVGSDENVQVEKTPAGTNTNF